MPDDAKEKVIGVILSGRGNDDLAGLKHIASNKGLVIVQNPKTVEFPYTPNSIVTREHPDCVRSPKEIIWKLWNVLDISAGTSDQLL